MCPITRASSMQGLKGRGEGGGEVGVGHGMEGRQRKAREREGWQGKVGGEMLARHKERCRMGLRKVISALI